MPWSGTLIPSRSVSVTIQTAISVNCHTRCQPPARAGQREQRHQPQRVLRAPHLGRQQEGEHAQERELRQPRADRARPGPAPATTTSAATSASATAVPGGSQNGASPSPYGRVEQGAADRPERRAFGRPVDAELVELPPAAVVGQRDRAVDRQPHQPGRRRSPTPRRRTCGCGSPGSPIATSRKTGYSFAAVPSPIIAPDRTGLRATTPTAPRTRTPSRAGPSWRTRGTPAAATARRSPRPTAGRARSARSRRSPRARTARAAATVSRPNTTSCDQLVCSACTPRVRSAVSHMNAPVSTGYSTVVSR